MPEITKRHNQGDSGAGSADFMCLEYTANHPNNQHIYDLFLEVGALSARLDCLGSDIAGMIHRGANV